MYITINHMKVWYNIVSKCKLEYIEDYQNILQFIMILIIYITIYHNKF